MLMMMHGKWIQPSRLVPSGQGSFSRQKRIQNCTERTVGYPGNYNGKTMQ